MLFSDIDNTLIFSHINYREVKGPPLIVDIHNEKPISYMTLESYKLLSLLNEKGLFVPVTTRSVEQYQRLNLGVSPHVAITSNGGNILVDGKPDQKYSDLIASTSFNQHTPNDILAFIEETFPENLRLKSKVIDDLFVYVKLNPEKYGSYATPLIEDLSKTFKTSDWSVYIVVTKMYIIPDNINKRRAVLYVMDNYPADTTKVFLAGDSILDKTFLETEIPHHKVIRYLPKDHTMRLRHDHPLLKCISKYKHFTYTETMLSDILTSYEGGK